MDGGRMQRMTVKTSLYTAEKYTKPTGPPNGSPILYVRPRGCARLPVSYGQQYLLGWVLRYCSDMSVYITAYVLTQISVCAISPSPTSLRHQKNLRVSSRHPTI